MSILISLLSENMLSRCEYTNTKKFSFWYKTNENEKNVLGLVLILTNHIIIFGLMAFYLLIWNHFLINISAWIFGITYANKFVNLFSILINREMIWYVINLILLLHKFSHMFRLIKIFILKFQRRNPWNIYACFEKNISHIPYFRIFVEVHEMLFAQRTFSKPSNAYANNDLLQNTHHCRYNQPCNLT